MSPTPPPVSPLMPLSQAVLYNHCYPSISLPLVESLKVISPNGQQLEQWFSNASNEALFFQLMLLKTL